MGGRRTPRSLVPPVPRPRQGRRARLPGRSGPCRRAARRDLRPAGRPGPGRGCSRTTSPSVGSTPPRSSSTHPSRRSRDGSHVTLGRLEPIDAQTPADRQHRQPLLVRRAAGGPARAVQSRRRHRAPAHHARARREAARGQRRSCVTFPSRPNRGITVGDGRSSRRAGRRSRFMATYSLGSGDPEIARLDAQAEFLREPTTSAARGIGHRSGYAGARPRHRRGTCGDRSCRARGLRRRGRRPRQGSTHARAGAGPDPASAHVRFEEGDVTRWRDDEPFDAVVGRLILFHLQTRSASCGITSSRCALAAAWSFSTTTSVASAQSRATRSRRRMAALVVAAFRAVGADPTIGSRLQGMLDGVRSRGRQGSGNRAVPRERQPRGSCLAQRRGPFARPGDVGHGLATEAELDLDTLATRVADSLRSTDSVLVPPVLAGAWGRRA